MSEQSKNGGMRVLIVEDDTLVGMGLLRQLQKLGHSVVGQAADAAEARQMFRAHEPQLVLLDIRLGSDGLEQRAFDFAASDVLGVQDTALGMAAFFAQIQLAHAGTWQFPFGKAHA